MCSKAKGQVKVILAVQNQLIGAFEPSGSRFPEAYSRATWLPRRRAPNKATLVGDTEQIMGIKEALTARGIPLHITQTGPHYQDICRAGVN